MLVFFFFSLVVAAVATLFTTRATVHVSNNVSFVVVVVVVVVCWTHSCVTFPFYTHIHTRAHTHAHTRTHDAIRTLCIETCSYRLEDMYLEQKKMKPSHGPYVSRIMDLFLLQHEPEAAIMKQ